jgi:hypothetical protein
MSDIDELKEMVNAKKPGKSTAIAAWICTAIIPVILTAGYALQMKVGELETQLARSSEQHESSNRAAFTQIYHNESTNQRQWERIGSMASTAQANERVIHMLELFTIGEKLDIEKLEHAVQAMKIIQDSGLHPHEIEMALKMLGSVKRLNPFQKPESVKPLSVPIKPSTEQRPPAPVQQDISKEQLDRYIEGKKGALPKK